VIVATDGGHERTGEEGGYAPYYFTRQEGPTSPPDSHHPVVQAAEEALT
jgi:hypothetical protein